MSSSCGGDVGLLAKANSRLEDGQAALLEQISMQQSWIDALNAQTASQAKELSKIDDKYRKLEELQRWESRNYYAERTKTALERANRAERLVEAMAQSIKSRDSKIRKQSSELKSLSDELQKFECKEKARCAKVDAKPKLEEAGDTGKTASNSVRTELLQKTVDSRDASIKLLNERLSEMINREKVMKLEQAEMRREKRRYLEELDSCKAELTKALLEVERLRKKLSGKSGEPEDLNRYTGTLQARRLRRLANLKGKPRVAWNTNCRVSEVEE
ncbi:hypothetical protein FOL47_008038 [Perkinsus chesapeaki]|uniref:Uncharacterized protein n=1 Tax=Perkinsus chesapeaki TaxID=330153 RepID=A0A7J6N2P1_PERCH|nr:hypothetical protein FOL47_008038 [Perkinsus chesapeaki]